MPVALAISSATVPANLECVITNAKWQALVALLEATFNGAISDFNTGNVSPSPDNRDWPWKRTNADGSPDRDYIYWNGSWVSPHPLAPDSVILYRGTELSVPTFDGGEVASGSNITGPFWEIVTDMGGKFPVGPGSFAAGGSVAIGGTGGIDKHVLTATELPQGLGLGADAVKVFGQKTVGGLANTITVETLATPQVHAILDVPTGGGQAHQNLPPYLGIWFIRRTGRLYYRA